MNLRHAGWIIFAGLAGLLMYVLGKKFAPQPPVTLADILGHQPVPVQPISGGTTQLDNQQINIGGITGSPQPIIGPVDTGTTQIDTLPITPLSGDTPADQASITSLLF